MSDSSGAVGQATTPNPSTPQGRAAADYETAGRARQVSGQMAEEAAARRREADGLRDKEGMQAKAEEQAAQAARLEETSQLYAGMAAGYEARAAAEQQRAAS